MIWVTISTRPWTRRMAEGDGPGGAEDGAGDPGLPDARWRIRSA